MSQQAQRIADARREPTWKPGDVERYMSGMGARHEQFRQLGITYDWIVVKQTSAMK